MSEIVIRPGLKDDLPAAAVLWQELQFFHQKVGLAFPLDEQSPTAWTASFERTLGRFSYLWVAELDGQISGFLLARVKRTPAYLGGVMVGEISDLYVAESLRGQKVAARLVALALEEFQRQQVHSVEVQVMAANQGGVAFWHAQGFETELVQVRRSMNLEE